MDYRHSGKARTLFGKGREESKIIPKQSNANNHENGAANNRNE